MTVLDAYAVVGYLRDEPVAEEVADLLREPTALCAVNASEVIDQLVRLFGREADEIHADLALLSYIGMEMVRVSPELGAAAGELRACHYDRRRMAVSLADCFAAATALARRRPLATSDPALAALVRSERGEVHALPDSTGRLP